MATHLLTGSAVALVGVATLMALWPSPVSATPPQGSGTSSPSTLLIDEVSYRLKTPPGLKASLTPEAYDAALDAAGDAFESGQALPSGWTLQEFAGAVEMYATGQANIITGEVQVAVSLLDDSSDLDVLTSSVNGVVENVATVSNGGITPRGGSRSKAIATFWVPNPSSNSVEIKLEWNGSAGVNYEKTYSIQY